MSIYAIDTETGGFKPALNALLSITLVELSDDLMPTRHLDLFILPESDRTVEEGAAKINGYTPELWAERKAIPLRDAFLRIQEWLATGQQALAHNAPFDREFVLHQEQRLGLSLGFQEPWLCSCKTFREVGRARRLFPENHKLETLARLCGHWGPEFVRGAHGSLEDAIACAAGYRWLLADQVATGAAS
jgi:DNA polymerase III epsilon subunit-like protein